MLQKEAVRLYFMLQKNGATNSVLPHSDALGQESYHDDMVSLLLSFSFASY